MNRTSLIAFALLAAFTFARAALAEGTYLDGQSVALPGEPLWVVTAGRTGSLDDERAINAFVVEKLKKMSRIVVASR